MARWRMKYLSVRSAVFLFVTVLASQSVQQVDAAMTRSSEAWGSPITYPSPGLRGAPGGSDGRVVRLFAAPRVPWGPGHRGIDIALRPGSVVRSVSQGTVSMAGPVAGANSVVIRHPDGTRSGYSFLLALLVIKGERVTKGEALGISGGTGPGHLNPGVLHLSWRVGEDYRDPLSRMAPRAWHFVL